MWRFFTHQARNRTHRSVLFLASCLLVIALIAPTVFGAVELGNRSIKLSNNKPSATTTYKFKLHLTDSSSNLGSIKFVFCANTPIIGDTCTIPNGMDASGASLDSQFGAAGFSVSSATANELQISRPPSTQLSSDVEYSFSGIKNPANSDSYYVRVQTFASSDATGLATNQGGLAFAISSPVNIHVEVPPYLTFCVGTTISSYNCSDARGDYVHFGELSSDFAKVGTQQLLAATNAKNGYNIRVLGQTMTSGNNTINPLASGAGSEPGSSQFGLNLSDNSQPNIGRNPSGGGNGTVAGNYAQPNIFRFDSGEVVASNPTPDYPRKYTVSYIVNVSSDQPPGVYATTMTYVALGNF